MRAEVFVFRHGIFPDLIGAGSLFQKPFHNRAPLGKELTWKGSAEIEQAADNSQNEGGQFSWVPASPNVDLQDGPDCRPATDANGTCRSSVLRSLR